MGRSGVADGWQGVPRGVVGLSYLVIQFAQHYQRTVDGCAPEYISRPKSSQRVTTETLL